MVVVSSLDELLRAEVPETEDVGEGELEKEETDPLVLTVVGTIILLLE